MRLNSRGSGRSRCSDGFSGLNGRSLADAIFVERNDFDTDTELRIVVRAVPDIALLTPRIDKGDHIMRHLDGIRKFIDGELLTADQKNAAAGE